MGERAAVPDVVIITGMSGAGRTEAMHTLEDMGFYVIDNLPPSLILSLAQLVGIDSGLGRHLAVVCDLRSQGLFDMLEPAIKELEDSQVSSAIVFLDASDESLRRRYSSARRRHPLAREGESNSSAIQRERQQLAGVREHADIVIDTTDLPVAELRHRLRASFSEVSDQQQLEVHVFSFGFKHGMPVEADLIIDVRFLPNPFYDPKLRALTGEDQPVKDFVMGREETKRFLDAWFTLLDTVMPGYVAEGKRLLSIGVGCTGGQHRSVVLAHATGKRLEEQGYRVSVSHRDLPLAQR